VPQGSLSPRQYAPHIYDPDPNPEPMTEEQIRHFAKNFDKLLDKAK
jgi:hypothetical protein